DVVALAKRARRFPVGKRAGRPSMAQETIHALMIRAARRGQRVVRLKGGDPFEFGPGVTSAVAAPALAGIPVTHRGIASAFTVLAGPSPESYEPTLEAIAPGRLTL